MPASSRTKHDESVVFDVLDDPPAIRVTVSGRVTLEVLLSLGPRLHAHPAFSEHRRALYDFRSADLRGLGPEDLRAFVDAMALREEPDGYAAAYLVGDDLGYGFGRMFQGLAEGVHRRPRTVLRDERRALIWLKAHAYASLPEAFVPAPA